jgi:hypothetical protein
MAVPRYANGSCSNVWEIRLITSTRIPPHKAAARLWQSCCQNIPDRPKPPFQGLVQRYSNVGDMEQTIQQEIIPILKIMATYYSG